MNFVIYVSHTLGGILNIDVCVLFSVRLIFACITTILNSCKIIKMNQIYFLIIIFKNPQIQLNKEKETVAFPLNAR